jgi:hypothetical protein
MKRLGASGFRSIPVRFLAIVAVAVGVTVQVRAADDPVKLPAGVSEITRDQLTAKVPNFFCFDYPFNPQPGKRLWLRVDDKSFIERYPDGTESRFFILGHTKARDTEGTIVVKLAGDPAKTFTANDLSFQIFIPDKGNAEMAILFRDIERGQPDWLDMAWSQNKKTILQKVE